MYIMGTRRFLPPPGIFQFNTFVHTYRLFLSSIALLHSSLRHLELTSYGSFGAIFHFQAEQHNYSP
jgi:hypothetical protein